MRSILYFSLGMLGIDNSLNWKEEVLFWLGAVLAGTPFALIGMVINGAVSLQFSVIPIMLSTLLTAFILPVFGVDWFSDRTHGVIMAGIGWPLSIVGGTHIGYIFLSPLF